MRIFTEGHRCAYEIECLVKLFYKGEKSVASSDLSQLSQTEDYLLAKAEPQGEAWILSVEIRRGEKLLRAQEQTGDNSQHNWETLFGLMIYRLLEEETGRTPPWGILTGIRPIKLFRRCLEEGMTDEEIGEFFRQKRLSPSKIKLALETAKREQKVLKSCHPMDYSLYLSIPFCPTRCRYCSFVSHAVDKATARKRMAPYVELLCREIEETADLAERIGLRPRAIYMGGGTPTSLTAEQLQKISQVLSKRYDIPSLQEYTVEAGRPDTITREKLQVLQEAGVTRISINPQSLDDKVLERIGRNHTAQDIYRSYSLARTMGFDNINMDVIAGLEGDTLEGFSQTIDRLIQLSPENITVHTLSVKRASALGQETPFWEDDGQKVSAMVEYAQKKLADSGYHPYYLYRQKNTRDNLENTGFCKEGRESYYNICIMEEVQTILAAGAGGVTKLQEPGGTRLERVFNLKYPYEYIDRFSDILEKKKQVEAFYERNHTTQLLNCAD